MNEPTDSTPLDAKKILSFVMPEITAMSMALIAIIKAHPDPRRLQESFDTLTARLQVGQAVRGGTMLSDTRMFELLNELRQQIPQQPTD